MCFFCILQVFLVLISHLNMCLFTASDTGHNSMTTSSPCLMDTILQGRQLSAICQSSACGSNRWTPVLLWTTCFGRGSLVIHLGPFQDFCLISLILTWPSHSIPCIVIIAFNLLHWASNLLHAPLTDIAYSCRGSFQFGCLAPTALYLSYCGLGSV